MSEESRSIRVSIFGKDYNIKNVSSEEYVRTLAAHVDSVMHEVAAKMGSLSSGRVAILAALNIADEVYKQRQGFREFTDGLAQKLEAVLGTEDVLDTEGVPDMENENPETDT